MILHTDIPTRAQLGRLLAARDPASVSIYLPTDPASRGEAERIELKNLAAEASRQLDEAGAGRSAIGAIEEELADLHDDDELWRYLARSLAVFATPTGLTTFRLANRLLGIVEVSDRFHLKPLLRAVTFPQTAFVLALSQGSVRVLEIAPDLEPARIDVPELPEDVASAAGKASIRDRAPSRKLQGSEGQKVRIRQYARRVDQALRPLLNGLDLPLILAAGEPIDAIFRSVNSYPHLVETTIAGNPDEVPDAELATRARGVLDELYAAELAALHELYALRSSQRSSSRPDAGSCSPTGRSRRSARPRPGSTAGRPRSAAAEAPGRPAARTDRFEPSGLPTPAASGSGRGRGSTPSGRLATSSGTSGWSMRAARGPVRSPAPEPSPGRARARIPCGEGHRASRGLRWKRSGTSTMPRRRLASLNVVGRRGGEHGQAAREVPPELVIVVEVGELFLDRADHVGLRRPRRAAWTPRQRGS